MNLRPVNTGESYSKLRSDTCPDPWEGLRWGFDSSGSPQQPLRTGIWPKVLRECVCVLETFLPEVFLMCVRVKENSNEWHRFYRSCCENCSLNTPHQVTSKRMLMLYTQLVACLFLYICTAYCMQRMEATNVKLKSPHCTSCPLKIACLTFMMPNSRFICFLSTCVDTKDSHMNDIKWSFQHFTHAQH